MLDFLKEYIDELVKEGLRKGFWFNRFRNLPTLEAMHAYIKTSGIPYLGSGSSRDVYSISTGKVLKIAGGDGGDLATPQNGLEIANWLKYKHTGAIAKIYDWDKKNQWWIMMEAVRTFEDPDQMLAETGIPARFLYDLTRLKRMYSSSKTIEQLKQNIADEEDVEDLKAAVNIESVKRGFMGYESNPKGRQLVDHFNTLMELGGHIDLVNNRHWGVSASGNIVAVDYGLMDLEQ